MSEEPIDRISILPDEILLHILSLLPSTKLRARTSLLSKRWRHLWCSAPALDFPPDDFLNPGDYAAVVDRCLRLYASQSLRRLRADATTLPNPSIKDFDRWIHFAASRSVRDLALSFFRFSPRRPLLPSSLFLCSQNLSSLKLIRCCFPSLPSNFQGFPFLKTLHLRSVTISNETMGALLSACRLLESLNLCNCSGLTHLEISSARSPCLLNLNLERIARESFDRVVVEAPSLRFLDFDDDIVKLHLRSAPNLHAAEILSCYWQVHKSRQDWMQILSVIADVEVLAVSCWFFEFMLEDDGFFEDRPAMFKNLKELHWFGVCITECNLRALVSCLRECPMLEKLCINLDYYEELNKVVYEHEASMALDLGADAHEDDGSPQPAKTEKHSLECDHDELFRLPLEGHAGLLYRLKVVTLTQFSNDSFGMQLVGFILRKAVALELLRLTITPDEEVELELLHKQLSRFPCASPHVQIELSEVSGNWEPRDYKLYRHLWSFP